MLRRLPASWMLLGALGGVIVLSGCPFEFEKEAGTAVEPDTFFDRAPPDTTFQNEAFFRWIGTDLDSDVVAFQYQLVAIDSLYAFTDGVQGRVLRSIVPASESGEERWTERRTDNFETFTQLEDGWYEFRARAIDQGGLVDTSPARHRFFVFFDDVPPVPILEGCVARLNGETSTTFRINAFDSSRHETTPRSRLEYSVQLRAQSLNRCTQHTNDSFTDWTFFPDDGTEPIVIGDSPPTQYTDLFPAGCTWIFTLRVRDPAGLVSNATCAIEQTGG